MNTVLKYPEAKNRIIVIDPKGKGFSDGEMEDLKKRGYKINVINLNNDNGVCKR
jgi:hypothetical protein